MVRRPRRPAHRRPFETCPRALVPRHRSPLSFRAKEYARTAHDRTADFNDRMLSLGLARVSEAAALACATLIGRGDEKAADQAAVNAMREQLNMLDIAGVVVIGEGERDEAPMLYHRRRSRHRQRPRRGYRAGSAGRHHPDRQGHAQRADRDRHGAARLDAARAGCLYGQARHRPGLCRRRGLARHDPARTGRGAGQAPRAAQPPTSPSAFWNARATKT